MLQRTRSADSCRVPHARTDARTDQVITCMQGTGMSACMRRSPERAEAARSALAECRRLAAARATPRPLEAALMLHGETHVGSDPCRAASWRRAALELAHAYPAARGAASAVGMLLLQAEQAAPAQARSAAQRRRILAVRPFGNATERSMIERLQHCSGPALPLTISHCICTHLTTLHHCSVRMALACPVSNCRQSRLSVFHPHCAWGCPVVAVSRAEEGNCCAPPAGHPA